MHERKVYEKTSLSNVPFGSKIIGVTWVDVWKSNEVRSRLCGQEFAVDERDDLFAGAPPLAVARLLVSMAAQDKRLGLMAMDVSCAFLYADAERDIFIRLPQEDHQEGFVGRLRKALYGTRGAPKLWQKELTKTLSEFGYRPSKLLPGVYSHSENGSWIVAHVDDLLCMGDFACLEKFRGDLMKKYECKYEHLSMNRSISYLGRKISMTSQGYAWEADEKHSKILLEEWDMTQCQEVNSPYWDGFGGPRAEADVMSGGDATRFRRASARINYLAQDRFDLCVAANMLSRYMASPRKGEELYIKRVLRYLKRVPSLKMTFPWQEKTTILSALTDSDWATCPETRRSTSGGVCMLGTHVISFWCRLQGGIALSSGEAELTSLVKGCSEGLLLRNLCEEMGVHVELKAFCDSSSARGISQRDGVGKVKHLETKHLWTQEKARNGYLTIHRIPRKDNISDALTHKLTGIELERILGDMGMHPAAREGPGMRRGLRHIEIQPDHTIIPACCYRRHHDLRHQSLLVRSPWLQAQQLPRTCARSFMCRR